MDYFAVSRHIRVASAEVLHDWEFGPHRPVRLTIDGAQIDDWVQVMRTAKAFPSPFPAGCCARDFAEDWLALCDVTTDVGTAWT
eukprot:6327181-Pyramimonas_sp.AAC.1